MFRDGAPATAGRTAARLDYTPSGGSRTRICQINSYGAAVGDRDTLAVSPALLLLTGDVLAGYSNDLSTGGTYLIMVGATLTEFDA